MLLIVKSLRSIERDYFMKYFPFDKKKKFFFLFETRLDFVQKKNTNEICNKFIARKVNKNRRNCQDTNFSFRFFFILLLKFSRQTHYRLYLSQ